MGGPGSRAVAARVPGAAALGLVLAPGVARLPADRLADPQWTADVLVRRSSWSRTRDPRVLATVWWYSASAVLLAPPLAGLVTGVPVSGRLSDAVLGMAPGDRPVAAECRAGGGEVAQELRGSLEAVVAAVAQAGRMRDRPLWAIATDSIANGLLALGRAVGDVDGATALAGPLAAAIGGPLPAPRYLDVGGTRFTRRASCCLVYLAQDGPLCTSCPRRLPAERRELLEAAARRW